MSAETTTAQDPLTTLLATIRLQLDDIGEGQARRAARLGLPAALTEADERRRQFRVIGGGAA